MDLSIPKKATGVVGQIYELPKLLLAIPGSLRDANCFITYAKKLLPFSGMCG